MLDADLSLQWDTMVPILVDPLLELFTKKQDLL